MFVDFNILNQLGSPSINSNTFANRPAAGQTGRLFVSTDTFEIYRDNGTGWDLIGGPGAGTITGTGTATQVAYFTGAQTIGSSANLFWDNTAGALGINTATPGAELDVHGTGTIVQVNATGATSNAYLAFQRTGTGVWRIGDTYNGGSNFFELHNTVLTIDALEFEAATNKSTFLGQQTYASGLATGNQFTYNLTVPNGVNITSPNAVHAVNSYLNLSLGGNTTVPAGARQGLEGNSRISFTGAGTLTMTQAATVRAFSALSSVYSFNGSAIGTITHLAGLRICFPDNIGSAINITNNYGLLLNDQTAGLGTVTYTNRWGIYQEGASDLNYFNGNMLLGSTTNSGQRLQVTGQALFTGAVTGTGNSSTYTVTAASGLGISKSITSTLAASANNDNLIGLDVNPSFSAGGFSGLSRYSAYFNRSANTSNLGIISISLPKTNNGGLALITANALTETPVLRFNAGTGNTGSLIWGDSARLYLDTSSSSGTIGTPSVFLFRTDNRQAKFACVPDSSTADASFFGKAIWDGGAAAIFRANAGTQSVPIFRVQNQDATSNHLVVSAAGNTLLNTATDAGFRLDCNGTANIRGALTLGTASTDGVIQTNGSVSLLIGGGLSTNVFQFTQVNTGRFGTLGGTEQSFFNLTIGLLSGAGGDARGNVIRTLGTMTVNTAGLTNTYNVLAVNTTINCTAGSLNTFRGFFHNPTLTATTGLTHRAIETVTGDVILGSTSGSTSIGATTTINASAQLQVVSTTKGFLPPVMTGAQAEAIGTPAAGLMVYANNGNGVTITTTGWWGYDGATWVKLN
jgi:hypothetical protein